MQILTTDLTMIIVLTLQKSQDEMDIIKGLEVFGNLDDIPQYKNSHSFFNPKRKKKSIKIKKS